MTSLESARSASITVDDVIINDELDKRPARQPDYHAENLALKKLIGAMTDSPESVLQQLVEEAMQLCGAGSAGVSVWDSKDGEDVFRWEATAGLYAAHVGQTMPRYFSPCGTVLDRQSTQLMCDPVRFFRGADPTGIPIKEALLVPFYEGENAVGTVWVVAHDASKQFDTEDVRIVTSLANFASVAVSNLNRIRIASDAEEALAEVNRQKDEFLATLAHELRNPLAPLRSGLQIMELAKDDEAALEQCRVMMERQLNQLVHLIDDLMDLSRISRGKVELRKERVELAQIVQQAVETSRPLISQRQHDFIVELPDSSIFVDADKTRVAQVFSNLLNNAAKYTDIGGRIRLSIKNQDGQAIAVVQDNGMGIPPHMLSRVFDVFAQVDRTQDKSQGGLGIGLSIVKMLVELHGGSVEAKSEGQGTGCEFVVTLPILQDLDQDSRTSYSSMAKSKLPSRRILVADDNLDAAASLAFLLRAMGNDVRIVNDGVEAAEQAIEFKPDVVLLDIGMPKLSGLDACRRIRQHPLGKNMIVIALTGWGQPEDRRQTTEAGFNHHLVKPVDFTALEKVLSETEHR